MEPHDVLVVFEPGQIEHLDDAAARLEGGRHLQDAEAHEHALVEQEDRRRDDEADRVHDTNRYFTRFQITRPV